MKQHARKLIELVRDLKPPATKGAEIGVWKGVLSQRLLEAFRHLNLLMVDPWDKIHTKTMKKTLKEICDAET